MRFSVVLVALMLALASAAQATPFTVTSCASGATDWTSQNAAPNQLVADATCPAPTGLSAGGYLVGARAGAPNTRPGHAASWTLSAPASTLITRLSVERYLGTTAEGWVSKIVTAEGQELERCERPWWATKCERGIAGGPGRVNEVVFPGLATRSVAFVVECSASVTSCANGSSVPAAWLAVYRATISIDDPVPPAVIAVTGTVNHPGWHRGTDTAAFSASDGSGVKRLRLVVGTTEVGRQEHACDYTRMQPCPAQASASFSFNTARVADGTHVVKAIAGDAAEQEGSTVGTLRVDRTAPEAPAELTASRGDDGTYTLSWTNADQGSASPIVAAHYALCDPLGVDCAAAAVSTAPGISRVEGVTFPGPEGPRTLRVWLEDEAGNVDSTASSALPIDTAARVTPRAVDVNPPILVPSGPRPSSKLRIVRARRSGSTLTVTGTIARAASARIDAQISRGRTGRPVAARARVKPRRGTWTARVQLPRSLTSARTMYLTVRYAGQSEYRATTLKRRLAKRAPRRGPGSDEFSVQVHAPAKPRTANLSG